RRAMPAARRPIGATARTIDRIHTKRKVVFITIDDGYHTDARVLRLIRRWRIPVTVFLTEDALRARKPFYRALARAGATIENHSIIHPFMPRLSFAAQKRELCVPSARYRAIFGRRPVLMRPPFGAYNTATLRAAAACRIGAAVMWSAEMRNGRLLRDAPSFRNGDIVLLHFRPELYSELTKLLRIIRAEGFAVAALEQFVRFDTSKRSA
ncbi:MAG TPA: polysaccharide deacetylase family protein, partial [Actinomycetota bacterium]|nr:polysaccharide deacetylase family protein [Actinomycetota bacterium]